MRDEHEVRAVFVRDAPTRATGNTYRLAPGEELLFRSPPPPYHRKVIFISNRSSVVSLMVRVLGLSEEANSFVPLNDPTGDLSQNAVAIRPKTTERIETNDTIIVRNVSAGNLDACILELFYT